jgi:hypothetical protein
MLHTMIVLLRYPEEAPAYLPSMLSLLKMHVQLKRYRLGE